MRDGDDVASGMCLDQLADCPRHPLDDGEKALAARGRFVWRGMPEAMEIAGTGLVQVAVSEALPFAEILLGEIIDPTACGPGILSGPGKPARMIAAAVLWVWFTGA